MDKDLSLSTVEQLADWYRTSWDAQDEAAKTAQEHGKYCKDLEHEIQRRMEKDGLETIRTERLMLSLKEELTPTVTDWPGVLAWIAASGKWELVRKQLNGAPFREMVEQGTPLPKGLEVGSFAKMNRRRR